MQARYSLGLESKVENSVYCLFVCTSVRGLPVVKKFFLIGGPIFQFDQRQRPRPIYFKPCSLPTSKKLNLDSTRVMILRKLDSSILLTMTAAA